MGRCAVGTTYAGTLFRADAHRAVANGLCRYIWWRYTSTLNWDDPVSLVCGLILLFAETYARIVLVLGYFCGVAVKSSTGAVAERDVAVADGGYFCTDL